jgi:arginine decarboxylase
MPAQESRSPAADPAGGSADAPARETAGTAAFGADDARRLYRIDRWGLGYVDVDPRGRLLVRPDPEADATIDLSEVVEGLRDRDIAPPLVLRFPDLLRHRLTALRAAFDDAIAEAGYRGAYAAVLPIKVNQQRHVVEDYCRLGRELGFGLEAGSKPELLAVLGLLREDEDRPILCNGFKDADYIETVVLATKLGHRIYPVVEKYDELELLIAAAQRHGVRPHIGIRAKLTAEGAGRWKTSSGSRSKFGLFVSEIYRAVERLRDAGMLDCLELLHCHPGSQLSDILSIKDTFDELAHLYAELVDLGTGIACIDVGGGLAVDYDGSATASASSMNYTLAEYAADVVHRIGAVCDARGVPHPFLISESGRAAVAYSSVLVVEVVGVARHEDLELPTLPDAAEDLPLPVQELLASARDDGTERLVERWHDAVKSYENVMRSFRLGYLRMADIALAERLFWTSCARIRALAAQLDPPPEALAPLDELLSETYFCNFSIFQSLPDAWAIDQVFPVVPLTRLDEAPDRRAVLADMTCDSDGRLDRFVTEDGVTSTIPVHAVRPGEPYALGVFLVGAYQETLGDLHNLFGDTHVVQIVLAEDGRWWPQTIVHGDTASELLGYMQYDVEDLRAALQAGCERAVRDGRMTLAEARLLRRFYDEELRGYAYLERPEDR